MQLSIQDPFQYIMAVIVYLSMPSNTPQSYLSVYAPPIPPTIYAYYPSMSGCLIMDLSICLSTHYISSQPHVLLHPSLNPIVSRYVHPSKLLSPISQCNKATPIHPPYMCGPCIPPSFSTCFMTYFYPSSSYPSNNSPNQSLLPPGHPSFRPPMPILFPYLCSLKDHSPIHLSIDTTHYLFPASTHFTDPFIP